MLKNDDFQSGSLQNRCFQASFNPFYVAVEGPESRKTGLKVRQILYRLENYTTQSIEIQEIIKHSVASIIVY